MQNSRLEQYSWRNLIFLSYTGCPALARRVSDVSDGAMSYYLFIGCTTS
jgi:hypothetical protein